MALRVLIATFFIATNFYVYSLPTKFEAGKNHEYDYKRSLRNQTGASCKLLQYDCYIGRY